MEEIYAYDINLWIINQLCKRLDTISMASDPADMMKKIIRACEEAQVDLDNLMKGVQEASHGLR